ncbi:MAG: hypothetical protein ACIAZJ_10410 [Gimesia chilikensis]|uniref:hypothetical protein n=1 Tax=Gimesia chilikensis TaxID=2605989 RepID=UPI0037A531E2
MQTYKKLLLQKLTDNGWALITQNSDCDWWLEEFWTIQSIHDHRGLELFILFKVDPLFEGQQKSQGVSEVAATVTLPTNRIAAEENSLALITVIGYFEQQADQLLEAINRYRSVGTE